MKTLRVFSELAFLDDVLRLFDGQEVVGNQELAVAGATNPSIQAFWYGSPGRM